MVLLHFSKVCNTALPHWIWCIVLVHVFSRIANYSNPHSCKFSEIFMVVGSFVDNEDIPIDDIDDEEEETAEPEEDA